MQMEMTADFRGSTLRETIECSPVTIWEPTITGSTHSCGRAACPPLPVMSMMMPSAAASSGPGRMANWPPGCPDIVHAVDLLDTPAVHQPVIDHRLAAGAALLGRLEDDDGGAVEVARLGQVLGGAEQHRCVAVMAAGVHLARRLGA